mmetsp:Transcript_52777/g.142288  ORF Transcript_52777/g.142288 Transcript_52777/m.142288 type:complete len:248 (-) Transcript_52777:97-840(-)
MSLGWSRTARRIRRRSGGHARVRRARLCSICRSTVTTSSSRLGSACTAWPNSRCGTLAATYGRGLVGRPLILEVLKELTLEMSAGRPSRTTPRCGSGGKSGRSSMVSSRPRCSRASTGLLERRSPRGRSSSRGRHATAAPGLRRRPRRRAQPPRLASSRRPWLARRRRRLRLWRAAATGHRRASWPAAAAASGGPPGKAPPGRPGAAAPQASPPVPAASVQPSGGVRGPLRPDGGWVSLGGLIVYTS